MPFILGAQREHHGEPERSQDTLEIRFSHCGATAVKVTQFSLPIFIDLSELIRAELRYLSKSLSYCIPEAHLKNLSDASFRFMLRSNKGVS